MSVMLTEVRSALRSLFRCGRSSWATVIVLSVGIALPTAIFNVLDTVALRGLPVPEGDRIVALSTQGGYDAPSPAEDYLFLRDHDDVFAETAAYRAPFNTVVTRPGIRSKGFSGTYVTANLFQMLGVEPVIGRNFTAADEQPEAPAVAMLSHSVWLTQFGGDPDIVGETVVINRDPTVLVGVMPEGFRFPEDQHAWTVIHWAGRAWSEDPVFVVGKLPAGRSLEAASTRLSGLVSRLDSERPLEQARQLELRSFTDAHLPPEIPRALRLLLWGVFAILLVACANAAILRLGDALARDRELSVRRALGARRPALFRLLLVDALLLAAISAAGGIGLAWALLRLASRALLEGSSLFRYYWIDLSLDIRACGFAVILGTFALLVGGLLPALWSLRQGEARIDTRSTGSAKTTRLNSGLLAVQVAICFALFVGSGLLVRSGLALLSQEPAYGPEHLTRALVTSYQAEYEDPAEIAAFWRSFLELAGADPEIEGVTVASGVPWGQNLGVLGTPVQTGWSESDARADLPRAQLLHVLPNFFDVLRLPMLAGRTFGDAEIRAGAEPSSPVPVVVSASFARRHLGSSPLGKTFGFFPGFRATEPVSARVVGVAADRGPVTEATSEDAIYVPFSIEERGGGFVIARGRREASGLIRNIDRAIAGVDPAVATLDARTYEDEIAEISWVQRRLATLFSLFAVTSIVLTAGGLFGMAVLAVRRRRKELAVRAAVGATPRHLRRTVLYQAGPPMGLGLLLGVALTWVATRLVAGFLYQVEPWNPWIVGGAAIGTVLLLLPAVLGPALKASRTAPVAALISD